MKDKIVLVTGSSSGIGFETAKELAALGAEVILAARNEQKLKDALDEIKRTTGSNKLKYYVVDFASQKSIRALAAAVKKDYTKIDVLINNAGGTFSDFTLNENGLEMTIATNHFAYFLLTNLLLDLVKNSDYARIINVASDSHYRGKIDFASFTLNKNYFILKAYEQSKLANVLFTFYLAEQLKNTRVTVNCLHPGTVKTDIGSKSGNNWYSSLVWKLATVVMGISLQEGAKTSVYLASSPEVKGITGKYFSKCKVKAPAPLANDQNLQKELWQKSLQLCPLN